jgi:hypothetical protein
MRSGTIAQARAPLPVAQREQRARPSDAAPAHRELNDALHLAEKAVNLGKVIGCLSEFDHGHDLGKSFAWSHVDPVATMTPEPKHAA